MPLSGALPAALVATVAVAVAPAAANAQTTRGNGRRDQHATARQGAKRVTADFGR